MTGFDETVPPDPDPSADGTATQDDADDAANDNAANNDAATANVVKPEGGPEAVDADDEHAPPMAGDDDIASGHLGE